MPNLLGPELAVWCEVLAVLLIGTGIAVGTAELLSRCVRSAVWQRAVWQACTITLLALVTLELTGLGAASVRFFAARWSESHSNLEIPATAFTRNPESEDGAATTSVMTPADRSAIEATRTWLPAIVWAIGSFLILARMAWGRARLAVFWWRCKPLGDEATRARVQSIALRMGLRRSIRPLTSSSLRSPAVFHWLFPVLALPNRFSDEFSASQQEAVLAHELAHLSRRDPAWQAAATLACAFLWWQPLAWWSSRRLHSSSEAAADEASLLLPDGPGQLAASLVNLAQRLTDPHVAAVTSMQGNGLHSDLARRVERLLSLEPVPRTPSKPGLALAHGILPICLSLLCILCTAWAPSRHLAEKGDSTMSVLTNAWRGSLAATVMWTAVGGQSNVPAVQPPREEAVQARSESAQSERRGTSREQDRTGEVLEALREQVDQLKKEGKREAAERLLQVVENMTRKFAAELGAQGEQEREAVGRKLSAVREHAAKLEKEGRLAEAGKLRQEAEAMLRERKETAERAERSDRIKQKLREVRQRIDQLHEQGEHGAAEKLMRDAEAMAREQKESAERAERSTLAKQKLGAVREQIERLRSRGENEAAEKLMRDAEAMARKQKESAERTEQSTPDKLRVKSFRDRIERLRSQGERGAAEKLIREAEAMAREHQEIPRGDDLSKQLEEKLKATREEVEQLRKQGNGEAAEKLMRDAEKMALWTKQRRESPRIESEQDLRAGLREVQRNLKELREQINRLQEQRSSNRD